MWNLSSGFFWKYGLTGIGTPSALLKGPIFGPVKVKPPQPVRLTAPKTSISSENFDRYGRDMPRTPRHGIASSGKAERRFLPCAIYRVKLRPTCRFFRSYRKFGA